MSHEFYLIDFRSSFMSETLYMVTDNHTLLGIENMVDARTPLGTRTVADVSTPLSTRDMTDGENSNSASCRVIGFDCRTKFNATDGLVAIGSVITGSYSGTILANYKLIRLCSASYYASTT
ncbi:hypothetical protein CDAR_599951 [Caerostris darwini]|uniref:Uncharacterized protein n=1 Tax=Caerostris darwini TaxID=1538125 RepID=A0AAV4RMC0_9ARAC|nr:hypothetical protein CDAR_599951 [Caerostris darwini]